MGDTITDAERERMRRDLEARRKAAGLNADGTDRDAPNLGKPLSDRIAALQVQARETTPEREAALEARRQAEADAAAAEERRQLAARWERAIPVRFRDAHLDQLEGPLAKLNGWDRTSNVLLVGNVGSGKTHAAVAAARAVHHDGGDVWFAPVVELLDLLRPDGDPDAMDRAKTVGVLILDDLGIEKPSDWTFERLYAIVNRRWLECRPTVVTSNVKPAELEEAVGKPMWSRLYHDALRLTIGGDDRRRA